MSTRYPAKEFKHLLKATFPDYKKREVYLNATGKVTFDGINWNSGGSKNSFKACTIEGKPLENKAKFEMLPPWDNPYEGKVIDLPEDMVIVEYSVCCGQVCIATIHLNPINVAKLVENKK